MKNLICTLGISALFLSNICLAESVVERIEIQACQKVALNDKADFLNDYNKNVVSVKPPVNKLEEIQTKITIGRALVKIDTQYEECVVNAQKKSQEFEQYVML
jgi:hypothetical protein